MRLTLTRRQALRRLGAAAAGAAGMSGLACGAESGESRSSASTAAGVGEPSSDDRSEAEAHRIERIGVQLYTVRSEMEKDVPATLARVAEIGYREVEFAGYFGHAPGEIRTMVAEAGLTAPASHVPPRFDRDAWAEILDDTNVAGHEYVVVAWIPPPMRSSLDDWRRTAEIMSRAGEQARAAGLQYAYHNHDFEFVEMNGRIAFDVFCEEADPSFVQIELDLFWITHGGGDTIEFLQRWPGRVPLVHVKDRTADGRMVDVGAGVIDWAGIFGHADHAGIRHFFVEHDEPEGPFRSITASHEYLSALEF